MGLLFFTPTLKGAFITTKPFSLFPFYYCVLVFEINKPGGKAALN
jgi:hypothetical protein